MAHAGPDAGEPAQAAAAAPRRDAEASKTVRSPARAAIGAATRRPEPELLPRLIEEARLAPADAAAAERLALRLARPLREAARRSGGATLVQELLQEFSLSSQEGIALMCLAEALLRIPDGSTRDALIRDKLGGGDWQSHLGHSRSLFVHAATWGLILTGRLVATHSSAGLGAALRRIVGRGGEPLVRKGVDLAMRLMGEQFVIGETIGQALARARRREAEGFRHSYDMLGEAAMTAADAAAYLGAYATAIEAIGHHAAGLGVIAGPGISVKLSALHPRYARAQRERVLTELHPRLLALATLARRHDIGLNLDAEEADRLELSLDLLERLCFEPALGGWNGIGFVVQAYQKRCGPVVDWLVDLARRSGHRLMVRLVKGAYWDSEIKRAQVEGQDGYPVYTRKPYTDVAYLACARRLLTASDAVYPQFATHNAQTLAAVATLAGTADAAGRYEFQCLHGMGEPLYESVVAPKEAGGLGLPCRIYAPVGTHDTLLAYLVRRLLENGANTSFVNRIASDAVPLETLVQDPVATVEALAATEGTLGLPHPAIPLPRDLYGPVRRNSTGIDLSNEACIASIGRAFRERTGACWRAAPLLGVEARGHAEQAIRNPANRDDIVGWCVEATAEDVEAAIGCAAEAASGWAATPPADRAAALDAAADGLEGDLEPLLTLLVREAGKTWANAVAEVREAVDFLRYYAAQARRGIDPAQQVPLGPVVCISPWNFPLAIFTGQVAAALAAGNPVLAKPAEQTPLVAAAVVRTLHAAGVPRAALQLLPGRGETVGAALVADARTQGVLFTGSTEVARLLQRTLAERLDARGRPVTLVAETGGQNAMVVDSSALAEQVTADVLASAFDSAGQRCSALRVLCVQREAADRLVAMLEGATRELRLGDPRALAVDVGPVIDEAARAGIERHVEAMRERGRRVVRPLAVDATDAAHGTFVAPTLIEIERLDELEREVFGPVLHVLRYERADLSRVLEQIDATGYGLTLGVHTRIDETVLQVVERAQVGNVYVNRNMVGAVVGVQPFGGEGLSGTGPKAGGPLYLLRLLAACPPDAARQAAERAGPPAVPPLQGLAAHRAATEQALPALLDWARARGEEQLAACCERFAACSPIGPWRSLAGPTGEADLYALRPRERVLCLAASDADRLVQLAAVLAVGSRALWPRDAAPLLERLPAALQGRIETVDDWTRDGAVFDAVLHHGEPAGRVLVARAVAARRGPIVGITTLAPGALDVPLDRLVVERSLSINTAAAGGNATLMTMV